jgi:hypothetical protein
LIREWRQRAKQAATHETPDEEANRTGLDPRKPDTVECKAISGRVHQIFLRKVDL